MSARVPVYPPVLVPVQTASSTIRNANPVRADEWKPMGNAANWLLGRGGQLVCAGPTFFETGSDVTVTRRWRFYTWPRRDSGDTAGINQTRIWVICGHNDDSIDYTYDVTVSPGSYSTKVTALANNFFTWVIPHTTSSTAAGEVQVQFPDAGAGYFSDDAVFVDSVSLYEVPITLLPGSASTPGVDLSSVSRGADIWEHPTLDSKWSAKGVWDQVEEALAVCRRQALFNMWYETGFASSATAFDGTSNLFPYVDPILQTRKLYNGVSVGQINVAVYATSTGGGEVRFLMDSGDSTTLTVGTSPGWSTGTLDVRTDGIGQSKMLPAAGRDNCVIESRTTGGGTITVYGISIGEGL